MTLMLGSSVASAQQRTVVANGASLPAVCSPGQIFFLTSGSVGLNQCVSTNTWEAVGGGGGTVTTSAPLSGNGEAMTPVTLPTNASVEIASLVAAGLTYPTSDGSSGDVLTTDGMGGLTLQPAGGSPFAFVKVGTSPYAVTGDVRLGDLGSIVSGDNTDGGFDVELISLKSVSGGKSTVPAIVIGDDTFGKITFTAGVSVIPSSPWDFGSVMSPWGNSFLRSIVVNGNDGITLSALAGAGDVPACLDASGKIYAGSNTMGVLSCP